MNSTTTSTSYLSIFEIRDFSLYLVAKFCAGIAIQMQNVAVGWQVYAMTNNPMDLGYIGLAQFLPFILLILIAGQIADQYDRRRIVLLCYLVEALCGMLLLIFTILGLQIVWPVLAILVLLGIARAFHMPAGQALMYNMVPVQSLKQAVSVNSIIFHGAIIVGPALGGLLYQAGPAIVYACVFTLLCLATVLLFLCRFTQTRQVERKPISFASVLEGLNFVRSKPDILGALSLDLFAVLFGGVTALLPALARDILLTGPAGLGLLRTAPALGAGLVSIILTLRPITRRVGLWMFGGVIIYGFATIVLGLSNNFVIAFFALAVLGAGDMFSVYIRHTLVQLETPDHIRGRVSAVNSVFIGASNELGEFESGLTAAWFGLVPSVVFGGIATLFVAVTWMRIFPALRRMDYFPRHEVQLDDQAK